LDLVRGRGIYVLLDFHEDGYSKEICEDGAPLWAIKPLPAHLPPGGELPPPDCHTSSDAVAAHHSFFDNVDGLQEAFIQMAEHVVMRCADDQTVLGFELFNEPLTSNDKSDAFSIKAATALRRVDPKHLIFWEASGLRNITDFTPLAEQPFPVPGCVYTVHI